MYITSTYKHYLYNILVWHRVQNSETFSEVIKLMTHKSFRSRKKVTNIFLDRLYRSIRQMFTETP